MAHQPPPLRPIAVDPGKRDFANRAFAFAKRAGDWPGMPLLPLISMAAGLMLMMVGAFGTGAIPLGSRAAFWMLLMTMELIKWQAWLILLIKGQRDWAPVCLAGMLVLTPLLPLEIRASFALVGIDVQIGPGAVWVKALVISAIIFVVITVVQRRRLVALAAAVPPPVVAIAAPVRPDLLDRAGIARLEHLIAIEAEDHYCRLHLAPGGSVLLHMRFGDAMGQLADVDGMEVNRGSWVASAAVRGAVRAGRRWQLALPGGRCLPVSPRCLPGVRARGWLRPPPG